MVKLGLIGCGHWGKNHLRVFQHLSNAQVIACADSNDKVLLEIKQNFPQIKIYNDYHKIFALKDIDAVVISTPTVSHYSIIKEAILNHKDVLAEKPITVEVEEAKELIEIAKENKRILMVGHTFLYNSGIRKIKEYLLNLGEIYYLKAIRTHLGLIRKDVNCIYDLAPHDISIFSYLLDAEPYQVSAVGESYLKKNHEDIAFITLFYPKNILANIHVSWIDSNKVREIVIVGSRKRIVFDDLNNLERVKIFEKGISVEKSITDFGEFQLLLRDGDIISPKIDLSEPLKIQNQHFIDCIQKKEKPLSDGENGLAVVKVLTAIVCSLKNKGQCVEVK